MINAFVRLKKDVDIEVLLDLGYKKDPANCEEGDTYFHLNNYFLEVGENFRIAVSTLDGHIDILCLAKEPALYNMFNLKPIYDLFMSGYVESVS